MTLKFPIYLDAHATTPCDPRVVDALLPCFRETFGNASSRTHAFGWQAEALVEQAREQVANLISCHPRDIVFTSGATESDNLAIRGLASRNPERRHIITSVIEHKAVLDSCARLEREGWQVTYLPVGRDGIVRAEDVEAAITEQTLLVSIMYANNEVGTINPIEELGALCKARRIYFHCDAVQALAYLPCDVQKLGIDLLSISAHKMYGPKGVGALYVRRRNPRVQLAPIIEGGGQERGLRSGTLNVPGIVGLGKACELASQEGAADAARLQALRDRMLDLLWQSIPDLAVNGSLASRLPNNLNVALPHVDSDVLITAMTDVAVSSGSACTSENLGPSYVLTALGLTDEQAHRSIRFGLTRFTTLEEIDYVAAQVVRHVRALGKLLPTDEAYSRPS